MTRIKRIIAFILLGTLIFSVISCGLVYIPNDEKKAFGELLPKFFQALDNGDENAIFELFSPEVREQSEHLQQQITALIAVYNGPTDEFDLESVSMTTEGHIGEPGGWESATCTIPARSGEDYYFFRIRLMFEHYDEKQIGITQLDFFTADEKCAFGEDGGKFSDQKGLYLHAEKDLECETRTINGYPVRYTATNHTVSIESAKEFMKGSTSFSEFVERFGEANARSPFVDYYYYELPREDGDPRYLHISHHNDEMRFITIVDDFKFIEMVWENE